MKTKIKKLKIGKRYWLDCQYDVSGIYLGEDERGNYLFGAAENNYCYLINDKGQIPMPSNGTYELKLPNIIILN